MHAKDTATGKEQKITITANSGLNEAEIQKMVKDAPGARGRGQGAPRGDRGAQQARLADVPGGEELAENRDKIPEGDRAELEAGLKDAKEVVEDKDPKEAELFKTAFSGCRRRRTRWRSDVQAAAGAAGGGGDRRGAEGGGGAPAAGRRKDDVIDAEYTEGPKT